MRRYLLRRRADYGFEVEPWVDLTEKAFGEEPEKTTIAIYKKDTQFVKKKIQSDRFILQI